ncbi:MAG: sulfotransferase domain-containing protein [Candidatus Thermoplasmatota archaeon]
MTLPDFVICGAQKSGTSSLSYLLSQHPKICETVCEEMHFFCWDETYKQGEEWYEKKFKDCESDNKIGEKTPYYMYHLKVPGRMKEVIPEA